MGTSLDGDDTRVGLENVDQIGTGASQRRKTEEG